MGRVSPHLAGTVGSVNPAKGKAKNKWGATIYDAEGTRKWVVITAESAEEARVKALKLAEGIVAKGKNKYSSDALNSIIDQAVADNRRAVDSKQAAEWKALNPGDRRRETKHLSELVDGELVYKPKIVRSPWDTLQIDIEKKDLRRLQGRVNLRIRTASAWGGEVLEELQDELDYIGSAKNRDDLAKWEERFNNKYSELVGDWKTSSSKYLTTNPKTWARENIRNHVRREFLREGFDKPTAYNKAKDYIASLSKSQLDDWNRVLIPIKQYNDRVHKLALDNNDVKALDNIIAVHHIQPVSYGGTVRSPLNITGVQGGRYKYGMGSEHSKIHDVVFDSWYENLKNQNVSIGEIAPPGAGVPPRIFGPSGELLPPGEWPMGLDESISPERKAILQTMDIRKYEQLSNLDFWDLLKRNPKKAMAAAALFPFVFGYAASGAAQEKVPPELLNRSEDERFLRTQVADNIWQATKHHLGREGGILDWAGILDVVDLPFYGSGQRGFNMNLKKAADRKMIDPTWSRYSGARNTPPKKRKPNIWT